jgi:hypothetical protein
MHAPDGRVLRLAGAGHAGEATCRILPSSGLCRIALVEATLRSLARALHGNILSVKDMIH